MGTKGLWILLSVVVWHFAWLVQILYETGRATIITVCQQETCAPERSNTHNKVTHLSTAELGSLSMTEYLIQQHSIFHWLLSHPICISGMDRAWKDERPPKLLSASSNWIMCRTQVFILEKQINKEDLDLAQYRYLLMLNCDIEKTFCYVKVSLLYIWDFLALE
jgi:hypothetical protein